MLLAMASSRRDGSNGNVLSVLKASNAAETSSTCKPPIVCEFRSFLPPFSPLFPPRPGCLSQPGRLVAPSPTLETTHHVSFLKAHWSSPMGQLCVFNLSKALLEALLPLLNAACYLGSSRKVHSSALSLRWGWITRSWYNLGLQFCEPADATRKLPKRSLFIKSEHNPVIGKLTVC